MRTHKNQSDIYIPLTTISKQVAEKYDYNLPKISEQKFNKYIKEVGEIVGINASVEVVSIKSGNKQYSLIPKWMTLTSHISIKTFITMCGDKGVSPKVVSEITGKSVSIIMKHYYGTNKTTIREEMKRAFA